MADGNRRIRRWRPCRTIEVRRRPIEGGIVNDLLAISGEPNVTIMESKALACTIVPGKMPPGIAGHKFLETISPPDDPIVEHPEQLPPGYKCQGKLGSEHSQQGQPCAFGLTDARLQKCE